MTVSLLGWTATVAGIAVLVGIDVWHARRPHEVSFPESLAWSSVYVSVAMVFGAALAVFVGGEASAAYFAGYFVEKSLSVDNLFVFAVILTQFGVPHRHRQRVLLIGVLGALVLRAAFIAAGAAVIERFTVIFLAFGAFLFYTGVRLARDRATRADVANSRVVRLLHSVLPVAADYDGDRLLVRVQGRRAASPLLVVVIVIICVDIIFAMDSIPAIFGITDSAYLVFTANAFALLGLRALYFLVVGLIDRLVHLHHGLAAVLGFIGVKLVLHYIHSVNPDVPEIPTAVSLYVIFGVLVVVTFTSLQASRRPGTLRTKKHGRPTADGGPASIAGLTGAEDKRAPALSASSDDST